MTKSEHGWMVLTPSGDRAFLPIRRTRIGAITSWVKEYRGALAGDLHASRLEWRNYRYHGARAVRVTVTWEVPER